MFILDLCYKNINNFLCYKLFILDLCSKNINSFSIFLSTEALTAACLKIFIEQRLNELGAIYKNVNTCSSYQYLTSANSKEDPISTQTFSGFKV